VTGTPRAAAGPLPDPDTFLSGESGYVAGVRLGVKRTLADWAIDLAQALSGTGRALDRLASAQPARRVLVLSVYRPESRLAGALEELRSDKHSVRLALGSTGAPDSALAADTVARDQGGGKLENLNRLMDEAAPADFDWLLVVDDDVDLPPRFLDRFVALSESLELDLAQPAQTMRSHAAWRVTRRRLGSAARRTAYVEIGPVTGFSATAARELTPFPEQRFAWGVDLWWGALARERGWRLGVLDALPVRHESRPVAADYTHAEAIEEARRFLADRPYLRNHEAQRTLERHRRVPRP
jgi:hypothetical protein